MNMLIKKIINKFLKEFQVSRIPTDKNEVYLTFDDGPEPEITEFILSELEKYEMKATFFCKGENAEKYSELLQTIRAKGHAIGNHTYSHIHSFKYASKNYVNDVDRADGVLHSHLFRPPWGSLTISSFLRLRDKYKIIYWSLESGDTDLSKFDMHNNMERLKKNTRSGDIVLFHCCKKHQGETKQLLPRYLKWLWDNGYTSQIISVEYGDM